MKWYHSIKVKLLGFFLFMCLVFLVTLILSFFYLRQDQFEASALKETSLATQDILRYIEREKVEAEVIVRTLAGIHENILTNDTTAQTLIPNILNAPLSSHLNMQSAGIWLEPYAKDKTQKEYMLFFNRNQEGKFYCLDDYKVPNKMHYRDMTFYRLGKNAKKGETLWTNVYTDPVTKIRMVTVVTPIYHQNTFVGIASLDLALDKKNEALFSELNHKEMYFMLIDQQGTLIGKSSLLSPFIQDETNIYHLEHTPIEPIINAIKPILSTYTQSHHQVKKITKDLLIIDKDPIFHTKSIVIIYHLPKTHWKMIIGIDENQVMAQNNQTFQNLLWLIVILTLLASIIGYIILQIVFVNPLSSINEQLKHNLTKDKQHHKLLTCDDKGEIGTLVENLNARTTSLEAAIKREDAEIDKRIKNEKLLLQQSKMAAMGEMMDAVAHQWKQPLNALSMYSDIIKSDYEDGSIDEAYIQQFREDIQTQIDHMVNTLDEFRSFFRPNKEKQIFTLNDVVLSVLLLTKDDLLKNAINVTIDRSDPLRIEGSENEFKHLVLNIINNAKDAFNDNEIKKRHISIRIVQDKKGKRLEIEDNAGGIPESIISDIFKANVTSKEEGKGTGIGLYMSTQIAKKHHASLWVKNQNDGACFTVTFL